NPNGTTTCSAGACTPTCNAGSGNCDGNAVNGCEAVFASNVNNCGGCGIACSNAHGSTTCTAGACVPTCNAGFADCDGNPKNGCERSITTTTDCGACNAACNLATATPACVSQACAVSSCNAGFGNCDGVASNGCETNTNTSITNCGTCTNN